MAACLAFLCFIDLKVLQICWSLKKKKKKKVMWTNLGDLGAGANALSEVFA